MASIDLLERLELKDYYPQKLSFSDAITLRGETQNGCPKKYGLEIVRKLLTLDSTAVMSVTSDINTSQNNAGKTERETNSQSVVDDVRPPWRKNVALSERSDNAKRSELKLHPMDLLVAVMNCCDDFLRQGLVEKMMANKLSIPILLPDVTSVSYTTLSFALRSLVPEVQELIRESTASLEDTLINVKNPVVSFIRVGKLHRSKSKLVNNILNPKSFNTFYHRDCPNGSAKRTVSNGSIEAAWFQSDTAAEVEFNCRFFTALNLRGDARSYRKQTQFLCESSTLVIFMVESFEQFKELYENLLKDIEKAKLQVIVCYISPKSPEDVDEQYFTYLDHLKARGVISTVMYDWNHDRETESDNELSNDLRKTISKFLVLQLSDQMPTYANISRNGEKLGFSLDEEKLDKLGKFSADQLMDLLKSQSTDCKPKILPLQGEPWETFGKLEREQRRRLLDKNLDEYFIAEKETQKRRQREIQCHKLIGEKNMACKMFLELYSLQAQTHSYYLNSCKIKLDARSRLAVSDIAEEFEKRTHENQTQPPTEPELSLNQMELKISNSTIVLEHIFREVGQMYEAVSSEQIRMKEKLKDAPLPKNILTDFPKVVARLLLMGQPLELMDGDASNVPQTWLKAVLNQIAIMTNNSKVFVLSIIGVQSSGKSTLLNALFGLQFPVSAGRCTRGIYCHLVQVDKISLHTEYDYVMVVDTEGLRAPQFTGKSTFRDNELATFAIGLADATIINMKGENWAEMKDILEIVAHGLIRIRKTKAELELMPRCMFVHQNVPAVDAENKNRLDQRKQFMLLDTAIKAAARAEGFTDINKFDDVIKYDPDTYLWYFPDLWCGRPPKARISQDYTRKASELRQCLIQLMKDNPSTLTISSFFLRLADLWNAMLHNDFVLCFRSTQEIISGTVLNDKIAHEVDRFKNLNKLEQTKTRESICSKTCIEELKAQQETIVRDITDAVENNFADMKASLNKTIGGSDIHSRLKEEYIHSLNAHKDGEIRRIEEETTKDLGIHTKKLENDNDEEVKNLKGRLVELEKADKDKFSDTVRLELWKGLLFEAKMLVEERMKVVKRQIKKTIRGFTMLSSNMQLSSDDCADLFKSPVAVEMPQINENDIVDNQKLPRPTSWVMDFVSSESHVYKANRSFQEALEKWEREFQNHRDQELKVCHLEQVMIEAVQLLGIYEPPAGAYQMCSKLPPGYSFTHDYMVRFIKFACNYAYNRSLENSRRFISLTDPLADIDDRHQCSISNFQQMTAEANVEAVSQEIFDYAKKSFVKRLGEVIKTEVSKEENKNPTLKSKRDFLRTILIDLVSKTSLSDLSKEKQNVFDEFMLYVEMGESEASENFFLSAITKYLKELLTEVRGNAFDTDFQKMVKDSVGLCIDQAKCALGVAETECEGCATEYVRIFKVCIGAKSKINIIINNLSGFTEAVVKKLNNLYDNFLIQANSSFEELVSEGKNAAIRPLFEKIMGCRESCPFCSAPCSQSVAQHAGHHRANHYPTGVGGTVDIWGLFTSTKETHDATEEEQKKPRQLAIDTCQTIVGTCAYIRTPATVKKYSKWYHRQFNWNYESFRNYKEIADYANWDIPHSQDHKTSLYWKWFMAQFVEELAKHHNALCPEIPKAWKNLTWEDAKKSLDESDSNFQLSFKERPMRWGLCPLGLFS